MKPRLAPWLKITLLAVAVAFVAPSSSLAGPGDDETTEDVLYMVDGRELHGHILSETATHIAFEVVDRRLNLTTRITYSRQDIAHIERGVAVEDKAEDAASRPKKEKRAATTAETTRYGRTRPSDDAQNVPGLYIIPMKGQLGTDIHPSIYKEVAKDVREHNPDRIIFVMDCKDKDDLMIPLNEATEQGLFMHHEYREIVDLFKDELGDVPQVMWVEDSVGFSSLLAMAWQDLYMTPTARLGGLRLVSKRAEGWSDEDIAAKMMAAWTGIGRGFLENGKYALELAEAMMRPEQMLSASFKGREVVWSLTDQGEFLVDNDDEETVNFRAKAAEDLVISDGTVENLDDLAFLLGYREYRLVQGKGEKLIEDYKKQWRRTLDNTKTLWKDYQQHRGWAGGDETLQWLGKAKSDLEKIIKAMERYKAVEIRWRIEMGMSKLQLEIEVEKLKEEITALKRQGRGGGFGGGGKRGFGTGGG